MTVKDLGFVHRFEAGAADQPPLLLLHGTGGPPYGASTIAAGDGSRAVSDNEKAGAFFLGKHVTEISAKLVR